MEKIFLKKFNEDNIDFKFSNEDELHAFAHAKFSQYAQEIECEYGVSSEDCNDGEEWYDEYHDDVVLLFMQLLTN